MLCRLPGGLVDDAGTVHDEVELRGLSGREEEMLAETGGAESAAAVTALLSRCVRRIGGISPIDEATSRGLLAVDRLFILLRLRELTFGDRVQGTVRCPWPGCGAPVAVSFSTGEVPVHEAPDKGPAYSVMLTPEAMPGADEAERTVVFRLPTGGDQEALTALLAENEAAALTGLLARCLIRVGAHDASDDDEVHRLSPRARWEIERGMESVAPGLDLVMEARCPECARAFDAPFDLQSFFFGELLQTENFLYREVHYLAYHYHWSESEIMDMSRERRRRYIDVLADEIERLNESA